MNTTDSGMTSTEVAVLMPVVIILSLLPFQWSLNWYAKHSVEVAAENCVDEAQRFGGGDGESAARAITSSAGNLTGVTVSVSVSATEARCTVAGAVGFTLFGQRTVSATASGPVERLTDG